MVTTKNEEQLASTIRAELYVVLAEYADKASRRPIKFFDVFRRIVHNLKMKNAGYGDMVYASGGPYDQSTFPDSGVQPEIAALIRREFWELFLQRIIAPAPLALGTARQTTSFLDFDSYVMTPYGISVVEDFPKRIQVHDPTLYLANFTNAVPAPDPVLMRYLAEAVDTFRDGHLLASVVLLGSASDRLLDVVASSIHRVQGGDWYNQTYRPNSNIKDRFDALLHKLSSDYTSDLDRLNLKDTLKTVAPPVFHLIRTARNDIAHPRGREFTWNEVSGYLHCFVGYYLCFNQMTGVLAVLPPAT